jgi:hypothetical protein
MITHQIISSHRGKNRSSPGDADTGYGVVVLAVLDQVDCIVSVKAKTL